MQDVKILTKNDLNEFRNLLNNWNDKLLKSGRLMIQARALCSTKKITREEYRKYILDYKNIKSEYKKIADNKIFVDYFFYTKRELKNNSMIDKNMLIENYNFAKKMLILSKEAIKNHGIDGECEKLSDIALKIENLSFRYKEDLPLSVNDVSFEIKHGEYIAIIGHNGSGKSTLSKLLIGVLEPVKGSMFYYGNRAGIGNMTLIRKFLGIVFQNPDNQFIGSTVRDDVVFGLENHRVEPHLMNDIVNKAIKRVGMEKFLDSEPLMLSGGQKQRVAIASALAMSPDILIFDEATSMLDPKGKSEVKKIMLELKERRKQTILSITHDMDEILNADKVIVMNNAKLVKFGTPEEVLKDKNFLRSIHLDIPFVALVEDELNKIGIKISGSKNMDELVDNLCRK